MKKKRKNNIIPLPTPRKQYPRESSNRPYLQRTLFISILLSLAFVAVGVRLFQLMILRHDYYESKAIDNQTRSVTVSADRGEIYDCNMNVLASSVSVETVFLDPEAIDRDKQDVDLIASGLSRLLDVDEDFVREQAADTTKLYKVIKRKVPETEADKVREFITKNKLETAVHLEADSQRTYPFSSLAAQVIGFTNAENNGAEGLEAGYDSELRGNAGAVVRTGATGARRCSTPMKNTMRPPTAAIWC